VVGLRQVDPGNIVHAADATGLLLVTQIHPITVVFTLPEDELPQVQQMILKGEKLSVEAYDRTETKRLAVGKLLTLDNQIDTTTGSDKVKAVFDNKENDLFPNQFVNIRLVLRQQEDALVIPSAAVQTGSQGTFVYVVKQGDPPNKGDDGSSKASEEKPKMSAKSEAPAAAAGGGEEKSQKFYVESRPIVIAVVEGSQVIVDSGLKPGERVVIDGQEKLKSGTKVSPKLDGGKGNGGGAKGGKSGASEDREKGADAAKTGADSKGLEAMGGGKAHKVGPKP
jgi:multidrug efflux system membrane fusion protein